MAKDKDRSVNPAAAQRKAEKQKAIKKNKSSTQALRNEKLARRNPERLQTQINDLKALESSGDIKPREKAILEELEKDLRAIKKARDALGDKAPKFGSGSYRREGDGNVLGKRSHDGAKKNEFEEPSSGSETDVSMRRIPMPRDTPPPMPRELRRNPKGTNANNEPLGSDRHGLPPNTAEPVKTTYSGAPQIRDLKQEAVKKFIPNIVRKKQQAVNGAGGLIEPEEMDRLEAEGYGPGAKSPTSIQPASQYGVNEINSIDQEAVGLAEEEERFRKEMEMEMEMLEAEPVEPDQGIRRDAGTTRRPFQPLVEDVSDDDI